MVEKGTLSRNLRRLLLVVTALTAFTGVIATPAHTETTILRNWATGLCLESNHDGHVYTLPCQDGNNWQTWVMYFPTDRWDVANFASEETFRELDSNHAGNVYTLPDNGGDLRQTGRAPGAPSI
ncbi:RICIN domain-containing protein [Nonomuraea endophytica]|uniref:RICIN domain-containing protein n=1 Tax=Nonomuraea endophytica TaxID=714136 RepID=UPI0037C89253